MGYKPTQRQNSDPSYVGTAEPNYVDETAESPALGLHNEDHELESPLYIMSKARHSEYR